MRIKADPKKPGGGPGGDRAQAVRGAAAAWNKDGFGAKTAADALKILGASNPVASRDVVIEAPRSREWRGVPIEITSNVRAPLRSRC